jgi:hypothetical protein
MSKYYEELCAQKSYSPDEVDKFLQRHHLPKLTKEETHNVNKSLSII